MIEEATARRVLRKALSSGGDFAELFVERRHGYSLRLVVPTGDGGEK
ncbi:MAG: hypothetical protein HPY75_14160 [Actinobacteria bacterium]|nr:hypothetical protein [Actinomycetota bacterium]